MIMCAEICNGSASASLASGITLQAERLPYNSMTHDWRGAA
jgi:hypothetical protein